jgi:integrase
MPRRVEPLNAAKAKALLAKGEPWRHADGAGLYLVVTGKGTGWWMFRYSAGGKQREMGLGPADPEGREGHTLADARRRADAVRGDVLEKRDPLAERAADAAKAAAQEAARRTFREVAEAFIDGKAAEWSNAKHRAQWTSSLATYAYPVLGAMPVVAIGLDDVRRALIPIWTSKAETAVRVRGRIEAVLDFATVHGWRTGPNPARWQGNLKLAGLPSRAKVAPVQHHPALPWQELPAFMVQLRAAPATSARALEFLILTATRTGEVLGAKWSEIDTDAAMWTVPRERMKAGKEHRVPLSDAALAVLQEMAVARDPDDIAGDGYLFPGQVRGAALSNMAMLALLKRMKRGDITPHGFRSSFRDWAGETTGHPGDVVEMALAHVVANKVEAAHRRGDMFAKRRTLMQDWAEYCGKAPAVVVPLPRARAEAAG